MYNYNRAVKYVELQKLPETSSTITRWIKLAPTIRLPDRRLIWDFQPALSNSSHKKDFIVTVHSFQNSYAIQIVEKLNAANTFQRYVNSKQQLTASVICFLHISSSEQLQQIWLHGWLSFRNLVIFNQDYLKLLFGCWDLPSSPSNVTLLSAAEHNDAGERRQQKRPSRGDGQETRSWPGPV